MHNVNYMCRILCDAIWNANGENKHACAVCVHSNSILVESNGPFLFNFGFEVDLLNA